ncbi:MAG: IMP dehydrogenase [Chlamydiota bacterium]|nr:IMP dehydrogenase [Chlamydiota bacterium]
MENETFFNKFSGESLTYADLIFLPNYVNFSLQDVDLSSCVTNDLRLNIPIMSSPMDTVTEYELAIAIALQGGLGVIHYNMSPEEQLEQVQKVKRFQNGFVPNPRALPPHATIRDVVKIRYEEGYSTIPITADGTPHGRLLGLITKYDYSTFSEEDLNKTVVDRMINVENIAVATYEELSMYGGFDLKHANQVLLDSHSAALPIVDRDGNMRFLITRSDLDKHQNYPNAALDKSGGLLVGAAVETWPDKAQERIEVLQECVDIIVFDTSQGYTQYEIDLIKWSKQNYPHLQIVAGNVITAEGCNALIDAGADAIRVGMGSGSICTTQEVGGIGRGQATAVYECAKACHARGKYCIADGGIKTSSDIVKALCLGADVVMLGSLLACTTEAPGRTHIKDGVLLKEYRGMGSLKAMERGSSVRYGMQSSSIRIAEGVSGMVSSRGPISKWVPMLMQGAKQGLHKLGHPSLQNIQNSLLDNKVRLEKRSEGAKNEGNVHSLYEMSSESFSASCSSPNTRESKAIDKSYAMK